MILPPSLLPFEENDHMAGLADRLTQVGFGWQHYVGKNLILSCALTFMILAILTKMKAMIKSLTLRSFGFLFDAALSFNMISAVSVSPIFPFCAVNQRSLFWKGKKGESHNKAWLTRPPPPVPLLSDNASMTSTLEGGPRRGGAHAMLVSIMKVTIQTWRGVGPGH